MFWKQYLLMFFIALLFTFIEIFLDFFKESKIAYRSWMFLLLAFFNIVISYLLFFLNTDAGIKFLNISNPWLLALVAGPSGFFLFSSKLDVDKIEKDYEWSGVKSVISCLKTKLNELMRGHVEKEYPYKLICYLKDNIADINSYSKFVLDTVEYFADKEEKNKYLKLVKKTSDMDIPTGMEREKIYYLTKILMKVRDSVWIKKNVVPKFCKEKMK